MSLAVDDNRNRGSRSRSRSRSQDRRGPNQDAAARDNMIAADAGHGEPCRSRPSEHDFDEDANDRYSAERWQGRPAQTDSLPYPVQGPIDNMFPENRALHRLDNPGSLQPMRHDGGREEALVRYNASPGPGRRATIDWAEGAPASPSRRHEAGYNESGQTRLSARRRAQDEGDGELAYGRLPPPSPSPRPVSLHAQDSRLGGGRAPVYGSQYRPDAQVQYSDQQLRPTSPAGSRHRQYSRDGRPSSSAAADRRSRESDWRRSDRASGVERIRPSSLTVDGRPATGASLATAPPSPLLESYRGTYQDCSPMPSPLLLAASKGGDEDDEGLNALSSLTSELEVEARRAGRRARFNDPSEVATTLARALRGSREPDLKPLIEILPSLTHEQLMELRSEYKRLVKTGADRKGVNFAKHIRARLKDEDANLMKACYAVALGRWASEAYWASFWYQGDKTRRELLIESLMGRSNEEVGRIKEAFSDKKYDSSLTRCLKAELKEDKFKRAVLTVLDERRMDERDPSGRRLPLDTGLVDQDVDHLARAVRAPRGGESEMLNIVVRRSDAHLRAIMRQYERRYRANFAREALEKSGNLVGEVLAHFLNGAINRPVRDALLLHHAVTASRRDRLRRELLTSRLVRLHWDAVHMQAVKRAYRDRYGVSLRDAVRDATSGPWGAFCTELCIARTPDDVRTLRPVD